MVRPIEASTEPIRLAEIIPEIAARVEQIVKTAIFTLLT
jgi:hypothetical protein